MMTIHDELQELVGKKVHVHDRHFYIPGVLESFSDGIFRVYADSIGEGQAFVSFSQLDVSDINDNAIFLMR
jgi:hypothetical protein